VNPACIAAIPNKRFSFFFKSVGDVKDSGGDLTTKRRGLKQWRPDGLMDAVRHDEGHRYKKKRFLRFFSFGHVFNVFFQTFLFKKTLAKFRAAS